MALEPEDRTEDLVGGHRSQFESKQSTAQMPRKSTGTARLVVEYYFDFPPEFLAKHQCKDGVDYARRLAEALKVGTITTDDIEAVVRANGDREWRVEAAK